MSEEKIFHEEGEYIEEDFDLGETVVLKSGGPIMVVECIEELKGVQLIYTSWFNENSPHNYQLSEGVFRADTLIHVDMPDVKVVNN